MQSLSLYLGAFAALAGAVGAKNPAMKVFERASDMAPVVGRSVDYEALQQAPKLEKRASYYLNNVTESKTSLDGSMGKV